MNLRPHRLARRSAAGGLSLVELLVSLTIGLILMVAVVSAYLGSAAASRMAESAGRMNEDAQAALSLLSQHIRLTGNNPIRPNYSDTTPRNPAFGAGQFAIRGCDATFGNLTTEADPALITCAAGAGPDSIVVRYEADRYNTARTAANLPADCLGNAVPATTVANGVNTWDGVTVTLLPPGNPVIAPANAVFNVADNRFYIANVNNTTIPNLYCKGNTGTAQPLVENIEDLQITYGVADPIKVETDIVGYLTADEVRTKAGFVGLAEDVRWSKVMSVRICVLVRSESEVAPDTGSAKFYNCAGALTETTDRYLRRPFYTTVVLRNRVAPT